jgi:hypothetical protein
MVREGASEGPTAAPGAGDLHDTAASYYLVMIANGKQPNVVVGGDLDGLRYFVTEIDGREYWVTDRGLFDPPAADSE